MTSSNILTLGILMSLVQVNVPIPGITFQLTQPLLLFQVCFLWGSMSSTKAEIGLSQSCLCPSTGMCLAGDCFRNESLSGEGACSEAPPLEWGTSLTQ